MVVRAGPLPAETAAKVGFCPTLLADADLNGPVGYTPAHHRGAEPVGLGDRPGGHEPAVAPPGDAEPGGISDAVGYQGVEARQDVGPLVLANGAGHHGRELLAVPWLPRGLGWNTAKPAAASHWPHHTQAIMSSSAHRS